MRACPLGSKCPVVLCDRAGADGLMPGGGGGGGGGRYTRDPGSRCDARPAGRGRG